MPQATDEQRRKWGGYAGVGEDKAVDYLSERGYTLTEHWTWSKPSPDHIPSDEELEAIGFLIDEWDYGGIELEEGLRSMAEVAYEASMKRSQVS